MNVDGGPLDFLLTSRNCLSNDGAVVKMMLFLSTQQYFNSVVADAENDQHPLFKTVSNLL